MKNKITFAKATKLYIIIILIQFVILVFTHDTNKNETERAFQEIKYELQNSDKTITEKAKTLYLRECLNILKSARIRNIELSNDEKQILITRLKDSLNQMEINDNKFNSDKIATLKHSIEDLNNGYNLISYTMEKIFNLKSIEFLKNQNNYFFLILTSIIYLFYTAFYYYNIKTTNNKKNEQ